MASLRLAGLMAAFALSCPEAVFAAAPECPRLMPPGTTSQARPVSAEDLIELRDIGPIGLSATPFTSVSHDGHFVAVEVRRADLDRNGYDFGIVVIELEGQPREPWKVIECSDEWSPLIAPRFSVAAFPRGVPSEATPQWSPDDAWVAYIKRSDDGLSQVWRVRANGDSAELLTRSQVDVEAFAWVSEHMLVYATRPDLAVQRNRILEEADKGFLYDERFVPAASNRPFPPGPMRREYFVHDTSTGEMRPASEQERRLLDPSAERPAGAKLFAAVDSPEGRMTAWTVGHTDDIQGGAAELRVKTPSGDEIACVDSSCQGPITEMIWAAGGQHLLWLKRSGWAGSELELYRWPIGGGAPVRLLSTSDLIFGCRSWRDQLLCAHEGASQPRRLVAIGLDTGTLASVFDPNPEYGVLEAGGVTRLFWKNDQGLEVFGDLVLPRSHQSGDQHPLVIVQYESRGFLRGGTGDEVPIQALASRGYAVLSFQRPKDYGGDLPSPNSTELVRRSTLDWQDRRSVQSALLEGVRNVVALGVVESDQIGITGLSDGASSVQFALINSDLFRAASISTCCIDPTTPSLFGISTTRWFQGFGYPSPSQDAPLFWAPYSLARNADEIDTPLLMQLADTEYIGALETYAALRDRGKPVEMYVFSDEHHIKWQPAHRLAIYLRNMDWFDFWLRGIENDQPGRSDEYARWREFRRRIPAPA